MTWQSVKQYNVHTDVLWTVQWTLSLSRVLCSLKESYKVFILLNFAIRKRITIVSHISTTLCIYAGVQWLLEVYTYTDRNSKGQTLFCVTWTDSPKMCNGSFYVISLLSCNENPYFFFIFVLDYWVNEYVLNRKWTTRTL